MTYSNFIDTLKTLTYNNLNIVIDGKPLEDYMISLDYENMQIVINTSNLQEENTIKCNQVFAYADLGLPSGTKWATRNVGAERYESYGNYYTFDEAQSLDCILPTKEQIDELLSECTWTWTTKNGVNGYEIMGTNGNSIFLPAAGYRNGSSLYNAGSYGFYWSATRSASDANYAYYLYFSSSYQYRNNYYRYYGQSVRPVLNK